VTDDSFSLADDAYVIATRLIAEVRRLVWAAFN
jgi:hypothetical protein